MLFYITNIHAHPVLNFQFPPNELAQTQHATQKQKPQTRKHRAKGKVPKLDRGAVLFTENVIAQIKHF